MYFTKEPPDLDGENGKDETTDNSDKRDEDKAEVFNPKQAGEGAESPPPWFFLNNF